MIVYKVGNIFKETVDALVCPASADGYASEGWLLQFKVRFPYYFGSYQAAVSMKQVEPGRVYIYETTGKPKYIFGFPTRTKWSEKGNLNDIRQTMADLSIKVQELGIRSIAIPPIGDGEPGLDWDRVKPIVEKRFKDLVGVQAIVFEP